MSFFRALATLTLERADDGINIHDVRFTAIELADKVIELGFVKKKPKQAESDWIRGNWSKLEDVIESGKDLLQQVSRGNRLDFYPWIGKEESIGGQGNYSYYYLTSRHFNNQDGIEEIQHPCPAGGLCYVEESLTNIPRWARWINGFTLQSWRKYAYILPGLIILLSAMAFAVLILLLGLYTEISTVKWLTYLMITAVVFGLTISSPLYRVSQDKIVMAPDWMTPLKETSVQLELKKVSIDTLDTGKVIRELRLLVYSAKCPICTGRVEVQSGGIQFPFRLVGRCVESPREHVFSFDHVTRTGKPLS